MSEEAGFVVSALVAKTPDPRGGDVSGDYLPSSNAYTMTLKLFASVRDFALAR